MPLDEDWWITILVETDKLMALQEEKSVKMFVSNWKLLIDLLREKGNSATNYGFDE